MAGVYVQDIELVYKQDRALLSDAISSSEVWLSGTVAGLPAVYQVFPEYVLVEWSSTSLAGQLQ